MFGRTRGGLISRRGGLSAQASWKEGAGQTGFRFLCGRLVEEPGRPCSHLVQCLHLVWLSGCAPDKGGWGSPRPGFGGEWEGTNRGGGEGAGAGEHRPGPGTRASDSGPLSSPGESSQSLPNLMPAPRPSCGHTPTHTHTPHSTPRRSKWRDRTPFTLEFQINNKSYFGVSISQILLRDILILKKKKKPVNLKVKLN